MKVKVIRTGTARCKFEPRGDNGLEGYVYNECYKFQLCEDAKGKYYRVYPVKADNAYETCGPIVFKQYFSVVS